MESFSLLLLKIISLLNLFPLFSFSSTSPGPLVYLLVFLCFICRGDWFGNGRLGGGQADAELNQRFSFSVKAS